MTVIDRTPYCHKIRYGITGAPTLTDADMDGTHAPGVGVSPTLIELVYSAARDGKPATVSASVTGWWTRFGERDDEQVTTHFGNGPSGWPEWLAEEARLHDPEAAVSVPPPATRADDRAAVLREAAEALGRMDYDTDSHDYGYDTYRDAWNGGVMDGADLLRRLADESAVVPPPALTEEGRLRAQVEVLQQDAERDQGLAKVGARCMREGHQGLIEQGSLVLEGWRFALSTDLGLGTGAPWEAIHERAKELAAEQPAVGSCVAAEAPHAETPDEAPWLSDSARIGRALIWSWSDVGKGAFGEGYRAAQAQARALLGGERGSDQQPPAVETQFGIPCSRVATRHEHTPHDWAPRPGMNPVRCPGFTEQPQ